MKQQVQKFGRFFERHGAAQHQCADRMGIFHRDLPAGRVVPK